MEKSKKEITMAKTSITYEHGDNLYVNMTNKCPNNCSFCLRNNSDGSIYASNLWYNGKEPSKEEILESLMSRDLHSYHEIVFCGYGEPACRWDEMMWLCDKIKEHGSHNIRINTNGLANLITNRDDVSTDLDGRVDEISVSLNSPTPEGYNEICKSHYGVDALPAIIRFTAGAVLHVPHVYMSVISTMSDEDIAECRRICNRIGATLKIREYIED